jgi:type IV pilus assembly protein PilE
MKHYARGMSLIELMIVLMIVAILAGIAIPTYSSYVLRSNRTEGRTALLALATAEEKYYLQCNTYVATLDDSTDNTCTGTPSLKFPATSERGYYTVTVTAADANGWTAQAAPTPDTDDFKNPQQRDTKCTLMTLTSTGDKGPKESDGKTPKADCWGK